MTALLVLGNIAIGAALLGVAHLMNWAGPSYAIGVVTGMMVFASWYRIEKGRWP